MKDNLLIIGAFAAGVLIAAFHLLPDSWLAVDFSKWSDYVLYLLLLLVGFNIGLDKTIVSTIKKLPKRVLVTPLITYGGAMVGTVISFVIIWAIGKTIGGHFTFLDAATVNSGLGYYSLTAILVTEKIGAELGSVALLTNLLRELLTIAMAPLIFKYFGKYSVISAGGVTVTDTTLPVILKCNGTGMMPVAIYEGIVLNVAVPVIVTILVGLA